jgi:hypothetical protein
MSDNDTENGKAQSPEELTPSAGNRHADTKSQAANKRRGKSQKKKKKWTLIRHWRAAHRKQQFIWIMSAIGGLIAVGYLINYTWGNLQTKWNFETEHRPLVVISRPPEIVGNFQCIVTKREMWGRTDSMKVWVKNLSKTGDAQGAFIAGPMFKLVPNKKIGDPFYGGPPVIEQQNCWNTVKPEMTPFPVERDQEVRADIRQSAFSTALAKSTSNTVSFSGPQDESGANAGENPSERLTLPKDTVFQLYAPVCVYYFDKSGKRYGSCRTYRFMPTHIVHEDAFSFSCMETPVTGTFTEALFGYCQE